MFKISKLILKTTKGDREIAFGKFSYVYGRHDRGKTILLDLIDFMMGDSDYNYTEKQAMEGVYSIELKIELNGMNLWLCRDSNHFSYKLNDNDQEYIKVVSLNDYKQKILNFITDDYSVLRDYEILTNKKIGYRSLSLFNYLPETGIADIFNVFPKSREVGEFVNIKSIMLYIFNKENVKRITQLKLENEKIEKEIKELKQTYDGTIYCEKVIRENMAKISLDNNDSVLKLKEAYLEYKRDFLLKKNEVTNKNLIYLIKASQVLSEEIKYQMFLEEQSKHEIKKLGNANKLLEMLSGILNKNITNKKIVEVLKQDIQSNERDALFLNGKDYDKSIQNLKSKKVEIDNQIEKINQGLSKFDYNDKIKIMNVLDNAFQDYKVGNFEEQIQKKEKMLQENNKKITSLSNSINLDTLNSFNSLLTNIYKRFENIEFVKADIQRNNFQLKFNPVKVSVYAVETKQKDGINTEELYAPGSKARMTLWQLVTYLAMSLFIKKNFSGMPFAPYICVDAVIQEFSDENEPTSELIDRVKEFVNENEIQIIMVGALQPQTLRLLKNEWIDIDNGLNPAYNYYIK